MHKPRGRSRFPACPPGFGLGRRASVQPSPQADSKHSSDESDGGDYNIDSKMIPRVPDGILLCGRC